jgi:hypothetical protein
MQDWDRRHLGVLSRSALVPVWVWLVAAFAAILTLIATRRGPGLSPDSVNYLSAGLNLADGRGLRTFDGSSLTVFPPGLPVIVAIGSKIGVAASWTIRFLDAAAAATTVLLGFVLLRRHVRNGLLVAMATVLIALSHHLLKVQYWAWSEPLFIVVALALVLVLEQASETRSLREVMPWVVAAACLATIGFFLRYAGVALIPIGVLSLMFGLRRQGWRSAVSGSALFAALASIGPAVWIARNHAIDGTLLGPRDTPTESVQATVEAFVVVLGSWVLPGGERSFQKGAGALFLVLMVSALVVFVLRVWRKPPAARQLRLVPLIVFACVYSIYIVGAELTTAIDVLSDRLLSPLYVPLLVLAICAIDGIVLAAPARFRGRGFAVVGLAVAVLLIGEAWASAKEVRAAANVGVGLAHRSIQMSPLANAAARLPKGSAIFSNDPWALWAATGREPLLISPRARPHRSHDVLSEVTPFVRTARCRRTYLVWYRGRNPAYIVKKRDLQRRVELVAERSFADGTLSLVEAPERDGVACDAVSRRATSSPRSIGACFAPPPCARSTARSSTAAPVPVSSSGASRWRGRSGRRSAVTTTGGDRSRASAIPVRGS